MLIAVFVGVVAIPGCGATADGSISERITSGYGTELLSARAHVRLDGGETALDVLERRHDVTLAADEESVQAIDGLRRDGTASIRTRWVLNVNGVEVDQAPGDYELVAGDVVQWDLRASRSGVEVPATIGAYPATLTGGASGRDLLAAVGCADVAADYCLRTRESVGDAGVALRRSSDLEADAKSSRWSGDSYRPRRIEILAGAWHHLDGHRWAMLDDGPDRSGVFARFRRIGDPHDDGDRLDLLDANGEVVRTMGAGTGLVAAMRPTGDDLFWMVTGVDARGAQHAARVLTSGRLGNLAAAAVTARRILPLPIETR